MGFDYLTIYDGNNRSALLRKWPTDIDEASVVPEAVESSGNVLMIEFRTGGFSSSPDVYEGFQAR